MGQGIQRVWFDNGEKMGSIFPIQASLGEISYWDGISPKRGKNGCDHLMHAIEVGEEIV